MLLRTLSRTLLVFASALIAGCVLYGAPEENTCSDLVCGDHAACNPADVLCYCDDGYVGDPYKGCVATCDAVACGSHASCGGKEAACFCEAGYEGNPYEGCYPVQPPVDPDCAVTCGQNAYCSEQECYCELDHVPVCGANAGCFPVDRLCDGKEDCPNAADESPAVCSEAVYQEWLLTDRCDDGADVDWKLFSLDRDWEWPVAGEVFVTGGYLVDMYQTIQCFRGETICFGGTAGDNTWGLGADGTLECDDCCWLCGDGELYDLGYLDCAG